METADFANRSNISANQQPVRVPPSDLCSTCAQPCSETEWKFSIEDGVNRVINGESNSQGKSRAEQKFNKLGRVSYRRPNRGVPCP